MEQILPISAIAEDAMRNGAIVEIKLFNKQKVFHRQDLIGNVTGVKDRIITLTNLFNHSKKINEDDIDDIVYITK
ncbi:hypothetical protein PL11_002760 [Lentilactobacillus curieae]|uniref:YolD-like protein n=1 Tax=Lentilactobacillus curieae TaxID=1138822 RepID=A0A1S6QH36_9LACO|nr:hypothetical protein [Lentilactobacillus curieae]AQW20912.1 hypothetical protein PL11_002760 [Lentilactobacillus curieae]